MRTEHTRSIMQCTTDEEQAVHMQESDEFNQYFFHRNTHGGSASVVMPDGKKTSFVFRPKTDIDDFLQWCEFDFQSGVDTSIPSENTFHLRLYGHHKPTEILITFFNTELEEED